MSTVASASIQIATREHSASPSIAETTSVALLGLGNVGSAVASLAARSAEPRFTIAGALVRDTGRTRTAGVAGIQATTNPEALLDARPDALVEVLGGEALRQQDQVENQQACGIDQPGRNRAAARPRRWCAKAKCPRLIFWSR